MKNTINKHAQELIKLRWKNEPREARQCPVCGTLCMMHKTQIYCSERCGVSVRMKRYKASKLGKAVKRQTKVRSKRA